MKAKHLAHSANTCILMMGGEVIPLISSFHPRRVGGVRRWGAQKPLFTPHQELGLGSNGWICTATAHWVDIPTRKSTFFQGLYVIFIYIYIYIYMV